MSSQTIDKEHNLSVGSEDRFATANALLASTAEALKQTIKKNPGMALLISASIGVVLACLSKRR